MTLQVYFAFAPGLGLVKIGCTANLKKRVRHLQVESGHPAYVLFAAPGDRKRERSMHRRFKDQAVCNEWFRPDGGLAKFLEGRGHGLVTGRTLNARIVGQMKRRYTMRNKRLRDEYRKRYGRQEAELARR